MDNAGTILIVDDIPGNLKVLGEMLDLAGFDLRPALSGEIALRAVSDNLPESMTYTLVRNRRRRHPRRSREAARELNPLLSADAIKRALPNDLAGRGRLDWGES